MGSLLGGEPEPDELADQLGKMDARSRANLARSFEAVLDDRLRWIETLAKAPESEWFVTLPEFKTGDPLVDGLVDAFFIDATQIASSDARIRTQLRLLRLHAAVIQFRWRTLRLPSSLDELGQPDWVADPLSGKPFAYRRIGPSGYYLYSDGSRQTGRIDLRYMRPSSDSSAPGEP